MKEQRNITCDIAIIGAGFAGMAAAAKASALGLKTVQTGSPSSLLFASGLFDYLGIFPLASKLALKSPQCGMEQLCRDIPGHPYAKTGHEKIIESFNFLQHFLNSAGLKYTSPQDGNKSVLTAAGTFKPTFIMPATFSKGIDLDQSPKRLLIVDFKGLREFCAKQIARVVKKKVPDCHTLTIEIPDVSGVLTPIHLAKKFEDRNFLEQLSEKIRPFSQKASLVGIPAVCGIENSLEVMDRLENMTGLDFFEIPGMPPSVPGLRLKNAFEKKLAQNKVINLCNHKVDSHFFGGDEYILTTATETLETYISAKGVILATGRFPGGGLHATRDHVHETIFNLMVHQPQRRKHWHNLNFFDPTGHRINHAGVITNNLFRPLDEKGNPVFERLYAVGSILAHNDWARLKTGSGVSCVSAVNAVQNFHDAYVEKAL